MNPISVFIPVENVFEGTDSTFQVFRSLLDDLSLTDTLFWSARLNLVVSNPLISDHMLKQQYVLNIFFTHEEITKVNRFVQEHGGVSNVAIFFRGQLLELLRWVCLFCEDKPNDGRSFDDPETRRIFAKALLIAGSLWGGGYTATGFPLRAALIWLGSGDWAQCAAQSQKLRRASIRHRRWVVGTQCSRTTFRSSIPILKKNLRKKRGCRRRIIIFAYLL